MGKKKEEANFEYLFEHGEVLNSSLDGVSIHPVTAEDTGVLPNSVTGEEGNCSGISP